MCHKYLTYHIIAFVLLYVKLQAQNKNVPFDKSLFKNKKEHFKKALTNFKRGNVLYEETHYKDALYFYLKVQNFNPKNDLLNFKIGDIYLRTGQPEKAKPYLETAWLLSEKNNPQMIYALARVYHLHSEWVKAIDGYNQYIGMLETGRKSREKRLKAQKLIANCEAGKMITRRFTTVVTPLGRSINSREDDYSPVVNSEENILFFTSRRVGVTGLYRDESGDYYEDIFMAVKKDSVWRRAVNLHRDINSSGHDAVAGIARNGRMVFIYRGTNNGDIYFSKKAKKQKWTKLERLPKPVNTKYRETSAAFSPERKILYFVSDRKNNSFGGLDIFTIRKTSKGWGQLKNIGNQINTPEDEDGVFLANDGKTLYFSSKGHNSIGGYDLFKSEWVNGTWTKAKNVGIPISTPTDDLYISVSDDGKRIYRMLVASNKTNTSKDLYMVEITGQEDIPVQQIETDSVADQVFAVNIANGLSTDKLKNTKKILPIAKNEKPRQKNIPSEEEVHEYGSQKITDNKKSAELPTKDNEETSLTGSESFLQTAKKEKQKLQLTEIKSAKYGISLDEENIQLPIILFNFGEYTIDKVGKQQIRLLAREMKVYPDIHLSVSGYTDSVGDVLYNLQLSKNRAKAVFNELVRLGVESKRLRHKGYGEEDISYANDNDQNRRLNRCVVFVINEK